MTRPMAPTTLPSRKMGVRLTTRALPCIFWMWPTSALPVWTMVCSRVFSITFCTGWPVASPRRWWKKRSWIGEMKRTIASRSTTVIPS